MESTILGLVLDSSVLVAAERSQQTAAEVIDKIRESVGDVAIIICALTVAELSHGIYRANTPERSFQRRKFLDEVKAHVPIYSITETTAEIVGRISGEQAAKGVKLPLADLLIGACAVELSYAVGTANVRHFKMIPGLNIVEF